MSSISEAILAGVAVLGALGTSGAFVWDKIEKRFKEIEAKLEKCERRERESQERRAVQLTVIELLWQEVKRLAPKADVLDRAHKLLDDLKRPRDDEPSD